MALRSLTAEFEMGSGSRLLAQITGPAKDKHGPQARALADLTVRKARALRGGKQRVFLIKPQIRDRRSRKADRPPVLLHGTAKGPEGPAGV